jgi:hypothetical protein
MTKILRRCMVGYAALALAAGPIIATAASAADLRDLVGARAAGGESDLESRGWVLTNGHKSGSASYGYWWNAPRKNCVMVTTRDGRYSAISDVPNTDCNQKSRGNDAAAAVGVVGAIALIAALASHKSGHHDNGEHDADRQREADYERGYNDGMYHQPYHNYTRSDAYGSGYQNGVEQRGENTRYRDDHRWGGGYAPSVDVSDLNGARAAGAQSDLQSRGFRNVDGFQSGGDGKGAIWWNGRTRQCLQVITVDGHVDSLLDIGHHQRCR